MKKNKYKNGVYIIGVGSLDLIEILGTPGYGGEGGIDASHAGGNDQGVGVATSVGHGADSTPNVKRSILILVVDASVAGIGLKRKGGPTQEFWGGGDIRS